MPNSKFDEKSVKFDLNTQIVVNAVRRAQPTYRAELSRLVNLKGPTITNIVNDLLEKNILIETNSCLGVKESMGRPPQAIEVNSDIKHVLSVDIEPDYIRVARTNLLLQVLCYREQHIDRFEKPSVICQQLLRLCKEAVEFSKDKKLLGIGLSLPGLIDRDRGILFSSTNMPLWKDVNVGDMLRREFCTKVKVGRPVELAAISEKWLSPSNGHGSTLFFSLRSGIGMCLMHNGLVCAGNLLAGEIGHTIIDIDGPQCECGNKGCLETFVSSNSICERARQRMMSGGCLALRRMLERGSELQPGTIYGLAKDGDKDCIEIVRDIGYYIGIAVANMVNVFGPDRVVIAGSIEVAEKIILNAVTQQLRRLALPRLCENLQISLAIAKEKAPLIGAAALVTQDLFDVPVMESITLKDICVKTGKVKVVSI